MTGAAWLRSAWRHAMVRYVVVGTLNTAFAYGVYAAALAAGASYPVASLVALIIGTCFSFRTQGLLVFRNARKSLFGRFIASLALVYLSNIGVIALFVHLHFDAFTAGAVALPFNILIGFALQRFFVFGPHRDESE